MKKSIIFFWFLLSLIGFSSCEDAKDPVINDKALDGSLTFKLNQPIYPKYTLEDSISTMDMDNLTCVQPDYGFTAAVTYTTEVSFGSSFASGTFQVLPTAVNGEKVGVNVKEMDKAIIALYGGSLPNPVVEKQVYIRLKAVISSATQTQVSDSLIVKPVYSNAISLRITPYVLPLFPFTEIQPRLWFFVGLADGAWSNSVAGLGKSIYPLSIQQGKKYNLNGDGEFVYTGYFKASRGFKLIRDYTSSSWAEQWCMTGTAYTYKSGDNITVPADGFYTVTLNSIDNKLTFQAIASAPTDYTTIGLIGNMSDSNWSNDIVMTAVESSNNHLWYTNYTFAADSECKFRANGAWTKNWGGKSLPYGFGVHDDPNLKIAAGSYTIFLNDIDGSYYFIKK